MDSTRWVDWSEADGETWEFIGERVLDDHMDSNPKEAAKDVGAELDEDGRIEYAHEYLGWARPMMNYAYPLRKEPDEEEILDVVLHTNCTVVYNTKEDTYFLALTGGGMDLSQDIAKAYLLTDGHIPFELAHEVSTQEGLSKSGKDWEEIMEACLETLENERNNCNHRIERIEEVLEKYKAKNKKEEIK